MSLRCGQCNCQLHEWEMPFSLCDDCHANPEPDDDTDVYEKPVDDGVDE